MNVIKKILANILKYFGYEIFRKDSNLDAFAVQKQLVKNSNPIIFDVGAYIGEVTDEYRRLFPDAFIYSFEPFPDSVEKLKKKFSADSRIEVIDKAITNRKNILLFNVNKSYPTNSLLLSDNKAKEFWGEEKLDTKSQIKVSSISIDTFCEENKITRIDILKLDIQGSEFDAFRGAEKMMSENSIYLIYFEMILAPTYIGQHKLFEYLSLMDSFGYELFDIFNPVKRNKQLISMDIIFINKYLYETGFAQK